MAGFGSAIAMSAIACAIAIAGLGLFKWTARRPKSRSKAARTCRACNGAGRIFTGVQGEITHRGHFHRCRVCKGTGVARE